MSLTCSFSSTRKVNCDTVETKVQNTIHPWRGGKFTECILRAHSVNCHGLSRAWFRSCSIPLRSSTVTSLNKCARSWILQDFFAKPSELVLHCDTSVHCRTGQNKLWPTVVSLPQHRATWNSTSWSEGRSRDYQLPWDIEGLTGRSQTRVGGPSAHQEVGGGGGYAPFSMEESLGVLVDPVSGHIEVGFCFWSCCCC